MVIEIDICGENRKTDGHDILHLLIKILMGILEGWLCLKAGE